MPYICCKCCGNSDVKRMEFIAGNKMIRCAVCDCVTALDPAYAANESSHYDRMKRAYQMLKESNISEPITIFKRLREEGSSDYRVWLGSVLAETYGLSVEAYSPYNPALLDPAMQMAQGDPNGEYVVRRAAEVYRQSQDKFIKRQEVKRNLEKAETELNEKKNALRTYQDTPAAMVPEVVEGDRKVDAEELRLKANKRRSMIFGLLFVLCVALTFAAFHLTQSGLERASEGSDAAFLASLASFLGFGLCLIGAVVFLVLLLVQIFKRNGINKSINRRAAEADQLEKAWLGKGWAIKDEIKKAEQEVEKLRTEIRLYDNIFLSSREFADWCNRMGIYIH